MPKAYVIVHDGKHVMVCRGGRVAKTRRKGFANTPVAEPWKIPKKHRVKVLVGRTGLHLPGGTKDDTDMSFAHTAQRELKEETGIKFDLEHVTKEIVRVETLSLPDDVTFWKLKVDSVQEYVDNFKRPDIKKPEDEPFMRIDVLPKTKCWENDGFALGHGTDWFGTALKAAFETEAPVAEVKTTVPSSVSKADTSVAETKATTSSAETL